MKFYKYLLSHPENKQDRRHLTCCCSFSELPNGGGRFISVQTACRLNMLPAPTSGDIVRELLQTVL